MEGITRATMNKPTRINERIRIERSKEQGALEIECKGCSRFFPMERVTGHLCERCATIPQTKRRCFVIIDETEEQVEVSPELFEKISCEIGAQATADIEQTFANIFFNHA